MTDLWIIVSMGGAFVAAFAFWLWSKSLGSRSPDEVQLGMEETDLDLVERTKRQNEILADFNDDVRQSWTERNLRLEEAKRN